MAKRASPASEAPRVRSSFWQSVTSDVGRTLVAGVITAIGGYLAAVVITPDQLYWYIHLRGSESYLGTWYGALGGRNARLKITDQDPPADGGSTHIHGQLSVGALMVEMDGGADSAVTLTGTLPDGRELNISLQRVQGAPRSAEEKMVRLVPQLPGQGAQTCKKITSADDIDAQPCKAIVGSTYFHL